tara:strand:- start:224 stop:793 length:570 start_codon:yes stop_codon:yes gene_type:complete
MNICVFGGAFDPLHLGHEKMISILLSKFNKVVIMPSKQSPGKKQPGASDLDRLKMLSLCDSYKNSNLIVDRYEIDSDNKPSYSIDSIKYIKNKFKEDNIYLALGLDQLNNLHNWHNIEELLQLVKIICFNRNDLLNECCIVEPEMVEDFNHDISSSDIKKIIQSDIVQIKTMVNKNIFNYIANEKLYQC